MKKQANMNNLAYIRRSQQPDFKKSELYSTPDDPRGELSKAIMSEMGKNQTQYLRKLISKAKNQTDKVELSNNFNIPLKQETLINEQSFQSEVECQNTRNHQSKRESQKPVSNLEKKNSLTHERTKSFGGVLNHKTPGKEQKNFIFSHRGDKNKTLMPEKFYSISNTPVSQKNAIKHQQSTYGKTNLQKRMSYESVEGDRQISLIESIDDYITKLDKEIRNTSISGNSLRQSLISKQVKQIKVTNNSKSKQPLKKKLFIDSVPNSTSICEQEFLDKNIFLQENDKFLKNQLGSNNKNLRVQAQLLKKLQKVNNYAKSLKLTNHILETENKKLLKKEEKMKKKLYSMLEHIRELTVSLQKERYQRKKAQKFFKEIQNVQMKFIATKKTSRNVSHRHQSQYYQQQYTETLLDSEITQHNDTLENICSEESEDLTNQAIIQNFNMRDMNSAKKSYQTKKSIKKFQENSRVDSREKYGI